MNTHKLLSSQSVAPLPRIFICALLSLVLPLAFAPASRAQLNVSDGANITVSGSSDLGGTLSTLTFDAGASGTFTIAPGTNLVLDSAGATTQRLTVPGGNSATFILDAGAAITFSGNNATAAGAAISVATGGKLILDGRNGAGFVFENNVTTGAGAAIQASGAGSYVEIWNALFQNNRGGAAGGLFGMAASSTVILRDVTIQNNYGSGNGAMFDINANFYLDVSNFLIQSNTGASQGIVRLNGGTALFSSGTFLNNINTQTSVDAGGSAIYFNNPTNLTLSNVSFVGTRSPNAAYGGALSLRNATGAGFSVTINVTTGTSFFADNTNSTGAAYSIYDWMNTNNAGNARPYTFNVAANATLDMLDPFVFFSNQVNSAGAVTFTKNGPGTWKLAGTSTMAKYNSATGPVTLDIAEGTLYLYGVDEHAVFVPASGLSYTPAVAVINMTGGATNTPLRFNLGASATLSVGGGNSFNYTGAITTGGQFNLQPGSNLTFDLKRSNATPGGPALLTVNGATDMTMNLITASAFNSTITLILASDLTTVTGSYNLFATPAGFLNGSTDTTSLDAAGLLALRNNASYSGLAYSSFLAASGLGAVQFGVTAGDTLWVKFLMDSVFNNVLTWTGAANGSWTGTTNWNDPSSTPAALIPGDIINLANNAALATRAIDVDGAALIGGMYVSGNQNYTITGGPITTTADSVGPTFDPAVELAATGKLILGGSAAPDGRAYATSGTNPAVAYQGTLTLDNTSNAFEQGIDIHSGQLIGNTANLVTGTSRITIFSGGTLTFNQTANATHTAPIAGAGNLNKTGSATLTLDADYSTFTGRATVNAGTLLLAPAAKLGGAITVNAATLAAGDASTLGPVTLNNNSTLQIGIGSTAAQILTIDGDFTLGALATDTSLLDFTSRTNQLIITGAISQVGLTTLNVSSTIPGSVNLINVLGPGGLTTSNFDLSRLTVTYNGSPLATSAYTLGIAANWLTILYAGNVNQILTWTGAANRNWDTSSNNWLTVDATPAPAAFATGDILNFTAAAAGAITIAAPVTAGAIHISGNAGYAFAGAGITTDSAASSVIGDANSGKLVLGKIALDPDTLADAPFTATLDFTGITGANNFTAGIDIHSGAIRISSAEQLGAKLSTLNLLAAPASAPATILLAADSNVTFSGAATGTANRLVITGTVSAAFAFEGNNTLAFTNYRQGEINGGAILVADGARFSLEAPGDSRVIFKDNSTISRGAALAVTGTSTFVAVTNALFQSNTANNGGALYINGGTAIITNATFQDNASTANPAGGIGGGAVYSASSPAFDATFSDVSFINNHSAAPNTRGGAIGILSPAGDSTLNLNATTGISFIAGNTWGPDKGSSGIAVNNNGNFALTMNINTSPGAVLDMLDPFHLSASTNNAGCVVTINKNGAGTWKLAGNNTLSKGSGNQGGAYLNINAGTLYLYRAGEQVDVPGLGILTAKTGSILMAGVNANAPVHFTLDAGANLSIGGGNDITISSPTQSAGQHIYLNPGSTLTYDLIGAYGADLGLTASSPLLSLNSTGLNSRFEFANTGTFNFNLNFATWTSGSFNLLVSYKGTAAGTPAGAQMISFLATLGFRDGEDDWQQGLLNGMTFEGLAPDPRTTEISFSIDRGGNLWVTFNNLVRANNVLTWTGADSGAWLGPVNWSALGSGTNFNIGDVINLADNPALLTRSINVDISSTIGGMYVSGTQNYTITGNPIVATTAAVGAVFDPDYILAASGKLILGGSAASNGYTYDTSDTNPAVAYHGALALANKSNNFQNGIYIYSGHLVGNSANLGAGATGIHLAASATHTPHTFVLCTRIFIGVLTVNLHVCNFAFSCDKCVNS